MCRIYVINTSIITTIMLQPCSHPPEPYSCKLINLIIKSKYKHQYNFGYSIKMSLRVQQDYNPSIFIIPFHIPYKFIKPLWELRHNINLDYVLAFACPWEFNKVIINVSFHFNPRAIHPFHLVGPLLSFTHSKSHTLIHFFVRI